MNILVMDDEIEFALDVQSVLEEAGYDVHWAGSASAALQILKSEQIDLIITDVFVYNRGQPTADGGITLISKLRTSELTEAAPEVTGVPIIAVSGARDIAGRSAVLKYCAKIGADYTLTKPLMHRELLETVNTALAAPGER